MYVLRVRARASAADLAKRCRSNTCQRAQAQQTWTPSVREAPRYYTNGRRHAATCTWAYTKSAKCGRTQTAMNFHRRKRTGPERSSTRRDDLISQQRVQAQQTCSSSVKHPSKRALERRQPLGVDLLLSTTGVKFCQGNCVPPPRVQAQPWTSDGALAK